MRSKRALSVSLAAILGVTLEVDADLAVRLPLLRK
jgi:hypothetical protein